MLTKFRGVGKRLYTRSEFVISNPRTGTEIYREARNSDYERSGCTYSMMIPCIPLILFLLLSTDGYRLRPCTMLSHPQFFRTQKPTTSPEAVQAYMKRLLSSSDTNLKCPLSSTCLDDVACERLGDNDNFICYDRLNTERSLFVTRGSELSSSIASSMELFDKYIPNMTPSLYYLDQAENYILVEYLADYVELRHVLTRGNIDTDTARQIGTVMGRNHAKSHSCFNNKTLTSLYMHFYHNQDVYDDYEKEWLKVESDNFFEKESLLDMLGTVNDVNLLLEAITKLRSIMLGKKESLVHADLNCAHVMLSTNDVDTSPGIDSKVKVVNFEKFSYGPTGIDLGIYLCDHYWYYVAHTSGQARRNLRSATRFVLEAYKSAFYTQADSAVRRKGLDISVDQVFNSILCDAVGFAGLFSLIRIHKDEVLPVDAFKEFSFGDVEGWGRAVKRRRLRMSIELLLRYIEAANEDKLITLNDFHDVLVNDDSYLATEHFTEFWHY